MALNKTLFLSFCMPPLKYPRSIQISRILKNMSEKPSVIYADELSNKDLTILPNIEEYVDDLIQIPFYPDNKYVSYIKRKFLPLFYNSPDVNKGWSKKLYLRVKKYILDNKIDTIVSFGQPMSVHLAALEIKKEFKDINWISHFSDPWVDNPLNKKGFFTKKYNEFLEKEVFMYSDKIIFTSPETISLVSKRYDRSIVQKFNYLSHSYDETLYDYNIKKNTKEFIISYIGGFYSQRSPKPLFEAVKYIYEKKSSLLESVKFKIVGNLGRHNGLKNNYKEILSYFEFEENVSYDISLGLMLKSDILLVIDAPADLSVFFPSKLVDYIGSRKPIIGITPKGTSSNIIKELGGLVVSPEDIAEIVLMLEKVLMNKEQYYNFSINKEYLKYESKNVTNQFCNIVYNKG